MRRARLPTASVAVSIAASMAPAWCRSREASRAGRADVARGLLAWRGADREQSAKAATGLEAAAIQAGVIPDPDDTDITGLYARDTDRVCIVPGASAYRIGVYVAYDEQQNCGGSGTATRVGENVHVEMDGAEGCGFDARFEGDRLVFPRACLMAARSLFAPRLAGALDVDRLSESCPKPRRCAMAMAGCCAGRRLNLTFT